MLSALGGIDWGRFLPPQSTNDLLILQLICAVVYVVLSLVLGGIKRLLGTAFRFSSVLRSAVSGSGLPVALVLAGSPFAPDMLTRLLTAQTMQFYMMVAGVLLTLLSLYGLFR